MIYQGNVQIIDELQWNSVYEDMLKCSQHDTLLKSDQRENIFFLISSYRG